MTMAQAELYCDLMREEKRMEREMAAITIKRHFFDLLVECGIVKPT
jgi:hypothetical protein